ncbi:MAG: hypothetical protein LC808_33740 [Actinobacteria bacterium]|nr:hypothetical protein [Actinomycetota bacterium]
MFAVRNGQQIGGGTVFVGGVAGVIALLIADESRPASLWCEFWFQATFGLSVLCVVTGLYVAASAYLPLPMPRTLDERRSAATPGLTDAQLAQECGSLGRAISNFAAVRVMHPMRYDSSTGAEQHQIAMANHDRESMDQYGSDIGRRVRAVVRELRLRGLTGDKEGDEMTNPNSMDDVAWIGCRLSEIGRDLA